MSGKVPSPAALAAWRKIKAALDSFPETRRSLEDNEAWVLAEARLKDVILTEGGKVQDRWDGARVRVHGFSASSTMGLRPACQNWLTEVTLKSAAAAMGLLT